MTYATRLTCLLMTAVVLLAGCGETKNKIGSTVQGTRVAILDNDKNLQPDPSASGVTLSVPDTLNNMAWSQAGYDPSHAMPNAALPDHIAVAWHTSIGEGASSDYKILTRPVIQDGVVYAMDSQGTVSALTMKGNTKWSLETTPKDQDPAIGGGLGIEGDTLYVTTGYGEVIAVDAGNGKTRWRHALLNPIRAAPTISGGRVYVVTIDNQLSALSAATGNVEWQHRGITEAATLMGASNPAATGDSVVVAYGSGEIYNLRAETGRSSWSYVLTTPTQIGALPGIADIRGLPIVDRGKVFAISHSGRVASIDQRTGDRNWEADIGGVNTPALTEEALYLLNNDGQLVALSRQDGRVLWIHEMQRLSDPTDKSSDHVYWTGPVLAGSRLWLTNSLGQLAAFSPNDGHQTDMIEIDSPISIPPVIANGVMFVVTDEGELVALK